MNQQLLTDRQGERGSLAVFLIVGVVLLGLTAGAAFVVTQRSDDTNGNEIVQQEEQAEEHVDDDVTVQEPEEDATANNDEPRFDDDERDEATAPQAGPADELPAAGPGEAAMSLAALLALSYAAVLYVKSRQYTANR